MVSIFEDRRSAVTLSSGQEAVFRDVPLYDEARLEVGIGVPMRHLDAVSGPVTFEVWAQTAGAPRVRLAKESLDPEHRDADREWREISVPLDSLGSISDLILRAEYAERDIPGLAAWSDPIVASAGHEVELPSESTRTILARDILAEAQIEPPAAKTARPQLLPATQQQVETLPAILIEPDSSVSWTIAPSDSETTLQFEAFVKPLRRPAEGEVSCHISVLEEGADPITRELEILDEPLRPEEVGLRCFPGELQLPPSDRPRTLRVAIEGEVTAGSPALGLTRLALAERESISRRQPGEGSNVLLLLIDTLRADHLGTYGYARETSPILDGLAEDGIVFERAVSQSSWTLPATASLMTGLYPQTHGCLDFSTIQLGSQFTTLAEKLRDDGYATAGFSANFLISRKNGFGQGFEHYEELVLQPARDLNESLLDWLEAYGQSPFFAYVHYYDPHHPYSAPEPFDDFFSDGSDEEATRDRWLAAMRRFASLENTMPLTQMPWRVVPEPEEDIAIHDDTVVVSDWLRQRWVDRYDGEIRYWDTAFGELLQDLELMGMREDTWIIVTSDHGEAFGEHEFIGHAGNLYEELTRVPLIILPPDSAEGERVEYPVELRDVASTVLEILSNDDELEGEPLIPTDGRRDRLAAFSFLRRENASQAEAEIDELAAMSLDRWKVIQSIGAEPWELFDLDRDPDETFDLSDEDVQEADDLRDSLAGWIEDTPRIDPEHVEAASAAARAQLRALGYFGR
ncbi:MAG: sulfatase [Planctomycetota bacterium]